MKIPKIVFPMAEKKITVLIAISRDDDGNEVSQFTTTLGNSREEGRDPCIIQNVSTHTSLPGLPPERFRFALLVRQRETLTRHQAE